MVADREDARSRDPFRISVHAVPDPVVGYGITEGDPVVRTTNEAFAAVFEDVSPGTTVERWLDDIGVAAATVSEVCSSLAAGDELESVVEPTPDGGPATEADGYRIRRLRDSPPRDHVDGCFLLTRVDGAARDAAGVEVDRIASVISHDLRNPLDVANAHLQAARETGDDEHFEHVKRAHDRMEGIIQDVLTLARGRRTLDVAEDVDLGAVAADAWRTVDTEAASMTLEDDLPSVEADPGRLQRLFENLFRNSVEHGRPESGDAGEGAAEGNADTGSDGNADTGPDGNADTGSDGTVQISVGRTDDGFFVADDGIGVPNAERDRVFEPGYSAGPTGTGTGLGLTIVEDIADAHGWSVALATSERGGARFEFRVDAEEARRG